MRPTISLFNLDLTAPYNVRDEDGVLCSMCRDDLVDRLTNYEISKLMVAAKNGDIQLQDITNLVLGNKSSRTPAIVTGYPTQPVAVLAKRWAQVKDEFRQLKEKGDLVNRVKDLLVATADAEETNFEAREGVMMAITSFDYSIHKEYVMIPRNALRARIGAYEKSSLGEVGKHGTGFKLLWDAKIAREEQTEEELSAIWTSIRKEYCERVERGLISGRDLPNERRDPEAAEIRALATNAAYEIRDMEGNYIHIPRAALIERVVTIAMDFAERDDLREHEDERRYNAREKAILDGSTGLRHERGEELVRQWEASRERYYEISAKGYVTPHEDDPERERLLEANSTFSPR
jgi:hypothetical protein